MEGTHKALHPADGPTNICSGSEMRPGATPNSCISREGRYTVDVLWQLSPFGTRLAAARLRECSTTHHHLLPASCWRRWLYQEPRHFANECGRTPTSILFRLWEKADPATGDSLPNHRHFNTSAFMEIIALPDGMGSVQEHWQEQNNGLLHSWTPSHCILEGWFVQFSIRQYSNKRNQLGAPIDCVCVGNCRGG